MSKFEQELGAKFSAWTEQRKKEREERELLKLENKKRDAKEWEDIGLSDSPEESICDYAEETQSPLCNFQATRDIAGCEDLLWTIQKKRDEQ
jgi:hypothetical protein